MLSVLVATALSFSSLVVAQVVFREPTLRPIALADIGPESWADRDIPVIQITPPLYSAYEQGENEDFSATDMQKQNMLGYNDQDHSDGVFQFGASVQTDVGLNQGLW